MLSSNHLHFSLSIFSKTEPRNYEEVVLFPKWKEAMQAELKALQSNNMWNIVDLPPNKKPIGCKRVYKSNIEPMERLKGTKQG
ncbi:hypothetical protein VIGAN_08241400 [Vigna angularis var. angularis]|uniref:Reverse transcriptase Ty1/copia-type domain-containing protein n=1 Tax=Vigna angularis var. angularis TaxID=157739 RepID=A0A0S3SS49_PHAAN|nr:hypothetical protein VIGAN_08241400 [Vigna angularis var. angularis]